MRLATRPPRPPPDPLLPVFSSLLFLSMYIRFSSHVCFLSLQVLYYIYLVVLIHEVSMQM